MHAHKEGIESTLSETKVYLDKLHQEISKTLEKIGSREKYINNQVCIGIMLVCVWCDGVHAAGGPCSDI